MQHPAFLPPEELLKDCTSSNFRHSGPGGQHRNKVETGVTIQHDPTGVEAFAAESRSRETNLRNALFRLRLNLAVEVRAVESALVDPSPLWKSRCRGGKISCNEAHRDFPALLSEALDAVHAKDGDTKRAAGALGCSTTQLVRFLAKHPDAFRQLNTIRSQHGLRPLKP